MEQFDILNKNGEPTGITANKGTKLKDRQYYLGVHAYIYNSSNEFLLQQRAFSKAFLPGSWDIHMGHVVAGETSREGIIREIQEEIGLSFPQNDVHFVGRVFWESYHHIIDIYFLKIDFNISELSLQSEEVIGTKVISITDMLTLVSNMHYRPNEYREIVMNEINKLNIADKNMKLSKL
ncbi:MAG: NUDIX domain-containing protein [Clostridiaceae bacterium]